MFDPEHDDSRPGRTSLRGQGDDLSDSIKTSIEFWTLNSVEKHLRNKRKLKKHVDFRYPRRQIKDIFIAAQAVCDNFNHTARVVRSVYHKPVFQLQNSSISLSLSTFG